MSAHDDIPSDCEPSTNVCRFCERWCEPCDPYRCVIDLDVMRRRRDLAAAVGRNWSPNTKEGA